MTKFLASVAALTMIIAVGDANAQTQAPTSGEEGTRHPGQQAPTGDALVAR